MDKAARRIRDEAYLLLAYYFVILLYILASLYPETRLWGINWWAYLPVGYRYTLLGVSLAAPIISLYLSDRLVERFNRTETAHPSDPPSRFYLGLVGVISVVLCLSFAAFPSTTFFLGDGYQLLARLAQGAPVVKIWDYGATVLARTVYDLLSGEPEERALRTYQSISIVSGVVMVILAAFLSHRLWPRNRERFLFFLGLVTGGYMLLFFGYVENYSVFMLCVLNFGLVGLLVLQGRASPFLAVLLAVAAIGFHIFGVILLPPLLYLLAYDTRFGRSAGRMPRRAKLTVVGILAGISVGTYLYLYRSSYFFTFAFLPVVADRFTVENDMLFSFKHLVDMANLYMLLVPGIPVFLALIPFSSVRAMLKRPEVRFLVIFWISAFLAVFIFNPGIGMPRNWDLFSIVGVPTILLGYRVCFAPRSNMAVGVICAALTITLGLLTLAPRVAMQSDPDMAIAHFRNYVKLDKTRSRNARSLLVTYYKKNGLTNLAEEEKRRIKEEYPEIAYNDHARQLVSQNRYSEAMAGFRLAIQRNPLYYDAYANLGVCFLDLGYVDSAISYLKIADGLNPFSGMTLFDLGVAYLKKGDLDRSKQFLRRALHSDSSVVQASAALAVVHLRGQNFDSAMTLVERLATDPRQPAQFFRETGDEFVRYRALAQAQRTYRIALARGADTAGIMAVARQYPEIELTP